MRPSDDLLSAIAAAPPRSIITLTEDGPYLLGGRTGDLRGSLALASRDLTIKSESGVHPVLRFAADAQLGDLRLPALLPFSGGNVTIEGLAFELDREGPEHRVAAISAEDTDADDPGLPVPPERRTDRAEQSGAANPSAEDDGRERRQAPGGLRRLLPF